MQPPSSLAILKRQAGVLVPIFFLIVLSFLQPFTDIFNGILKPIVIGILSLFGHDIVDGGSFIQVGNLNIGWSRDCTGINQFLLLLAMVIWMRRRNLWVPSTIYACLWAVPAALVANVARVLTIIGYRIWFFPEIESPELHYFIGFLWILPLVCLLLPSMERRKIRRWIEFAHALAVLALLAPLLGASEGLAMGAATAIILAKSQVPGIWTRRRLGLLAVWTGIGFAIASLRMESFWLPWLLISPLTAKKEWLRQPRAILLLLCSHPLFDLIPGGNAITWLAVVWTLWIDFIKAPSTAAPGTSGKANAHISANLWWIRGSIAMSLVMLTAPFTAALFLQNYLSPPWPPENARIQLVDGQGFELRLDGAPPEMGIFWYPPKNYDRHHTLKICMKYGGTTLRRLDDYPQIWSSSELYYREFFLLKNELLESHAEYVLATLGAWAPPGIHLVFAVRHSDMEPGNFQQFSQELAERILLESFNPQNPK